MNRPRFDYCAPEYQIATRSEIVRQSLLGATTLLILAAVCVLVMML